jgi:hypothetical protein
MRRLVPFVGVLILIVIIELFLGNDGEVKAVSDTMGEGSLQSSSSMVKVSETLTLSYHIYLPSTCRNFPPVIQMPEGEYLFVEYWTHSALGEDCAGQCIDFPAYLFDPQSGELTIYTTDPPEPALVLNDGEIGYIGSGLSLGGVGCGVNSSLAKIQHCPLSQDGITLRYVDESGVAILERQGETVVLKPGEVWVSDEETEIWDWLGAGCIVTSTHYISNYAFQDRDKIVYPLFCW